MRNRTICLIFPAFLCVIWNKNQIWWAVAPIRRVNYKTVQVVLYHFHNSLKVMKVPYFLNPWFARFLITWLPEPAEMVNLKETAEMSDSDNESANDNFEYCSTNQSDHLLLHKPTFWLGTQNGLWVTNIEHLLCCLGETLSIIRWSSNSNFHRNIIHTNCSV